MGSTSYIAVILASFHSSGITSVHKEVFLIVLEGLTIVGAASAGGMY